MNELQKQHPSRAVAYWVMIGVVMLLIQVVLGGITRLTGSGLSITEWNIVTGTLPPLNEQQWINEFNKYKETPQYQVLNSDFALGDFKYIFFWEWLHRVWARIIAVAFAIPFIIFLIRGKIRKDMVSQLVLLFLLGALQGAIGWLMVKTGLTGDAIYVKPTRLALHFVFALGLIAYAFRVGIKWLYPDVGGVYIKLRGLTSFIIILTFFQFVFGALMAGHKAANVAPTWPDINGSMVPAGMFKTNSLALEVVENKLTIHFIHRTTGYLLFLFVLVWTILAHSKKSNSSSFLATRRFPLLLITLQIVLGVLSVLTSPEIIVNHWGRFEWMAILHQLIGMLFLLVMVWFHYLMGSDKGISRSIPA